MASLMPGGKQTYFDDAGDPLAGGLLYTYAAGTSTPLATYSDKAGTTPNANPVVLDARGEATVFWGAASYKVSLHDSADAEIWTQDDVDPVALVSGYAPLASPAFTGTPTGLGAGTVTAEWGTTARTIIEWVSATVNVKGLGAVGDGVTNDSAALQAAIDAATTGSTRGRVVLPPGDYVVSAANLTTAASIEIEGSMRGSSEMQTRLLCAASGLLFERSAGADNVIGVHLKNLRIDKTGAAKAAGSYGVKLVGANSNIEIDNVEVRYFEKPWWLRGTIGGNFRNISGRGGKWGLYTETNPALSYDTTNLAFHGCKFNDSNEVGVYLGALTQGINFFGGNIERNTVSGVEFANTAPASSAINFWGTWFEENPTHHVFTQKPTPVRFMGCYIYGGTNLFSNGGSGSISADYEGCRFPANTAIDFDIFTGAWIDNSLDASVVISATEPNGYYKKKFRGGTFTNAAKTIRNIENIGGGIYSVRAGGAPPAAGFAGGSTWLDDSAKTWYVYDGTDWLALAPALSASAALDFGSVPANTATTALTIALSGITGANPVSLSFSGDPLGLQFVARSETNQVKIYAINVTAGAIDPGSLTFTVRVFK